MAMSEQAKEQRRKYQREYRAKNAEKIRDYNRKWRKANPDKVKANFERYWEKQAKQSKEKPSE